MSSTIRFQDGDLEIDSTGGQKVIRGAEKAAQDVLLELLLPYQSDRDRGNELFLSDGTLNSVVGSPELGAQTIRAYIRSAVGRVIRAQRNNPQLDRSEVIQKITTLVVRPLDDDVTSYGFYLGLQVADENIALARAIRLGHLGETRRPLVGGFDETE